MSALAEWILANADAVSGYVVLIIAAVVFIWALGTGKLYLGRNIERVVAEKDRQLAACQADLEAWQRLPPPPPPSTGGVR